MMKTPKVLYAPLLFLIVIMLALTPCKADELKPVERQPIAKLVEALKSSGHKRIAQGLHIGLARDTETEKLFVPRMPLMLTKKGDTDEWTLSIFHDKLIGSTLLIGDKLEKIDTTKPRHLSTFKPKAVEEFLMITTRVGLAYYPDEVKRLVDDFGYRRVYTGKIKSTTLLEHKDIKETSATFPVFFDLLEIPDEKRFSILVVDQFGVCMKVLGGYSFSENDQIP